MKSVPTTDGARAPQSRSLSGGRTMRSATRRVVASEQVVIEGVEPATADGQVAVKAIAGDTIAIEATVFRHGHEHVRAAAQWRGPGDDTIREIAMTLVNPGLDRWRCELTLDRVGRYRLAVIGWTDVYASWLEELAKRIRARQPDVSSEIAAGLALIERVCPRRGDPRRDVLALLERLRATAADPLQIVELASADAALELMARAAARVDEARSDPELVIMADRERAGVGAWYELFVRSQATEPGRAGTFRDAERRLADIREMGFDVVYLAPIHPIGRTNRKGANNALTAAAGDPGSPWAIGNEHGGHTAIEPALGTLEDFDRFVGAAGGHGLEVALDFAIQCSPDHPWVREHPEWFYRRPDGTIRYAENPPKKYQDIYPLNFDTPDRQGLWDALLQVVQFWVAHGVRIFRVDNPHTKPIGFWTWLIDSVQADHPDVIFLAEAFTRPPMMQALAKRGFTQSYTYFTWRNTKAELIEYMIELTQPERTRYFRPNFFANTPDILPPILQTGGRAAFKMRLALAATLSPTYGIYSGFELCESDAIEGREEYLHSEKYEIKVRNWQAPGNINEFVAAVNRARRDNPSLGRLDNIRFLDIADEQLMAYVKQTPTRDNTVIVVVNLDPHAAHEAMLDVPREIVHPGPDGSFTVHDVITGRRHRWTSRNYVRLDPIDGEPVHLLRVESE